MASGLKQRDPYILKPTDIMADGSIRQACMQCHSISTVRRQREAGQGSISSNWFYLQDVLGITVGRDFLMDFVSYLYDWKTLIHKVESFLKVWCSDGKPGLGGQTAWIQILKSIGYWLWFWPSCSSFLSQFGHLPNENNNHIYLTWNCGEWLRWYMWRSQLVARLKHVWAG